MTSFYSENERNRDKLLTRVRLVLAAAFAVAVLTVSAICCTLVTTGTALRMQIISTAVCTIGGWILIYYVPYGVKASHYSVVHEDMVLEGMRLEQQEIYEGRFHVEKERISIRNSISIYKVVVETPEGNKRLHLWDRKRRQLPGEGEGTLVTVNGYVCRAEVKA